MKKRQKICFLIPSVSSGGIETYLLRFLKFHRSNHDITVIIRSNNKGELYNSYKSLDINLIFKPLGYLNPKRIIEYYQLFKREKYDIVCDFNANFSAIPLKIAKMQRIEKRVAFYRQGSDHFQVTWVKKIVNNYFNNTVNRTATDILLNSHAALSYFFPFKEKSDQRFDVIYNGVEAEIFNSNENKNNIRKDFDFDSKKFVVGHVGRLDSSKNHKAILKTAKILLATGIEVQFVLCGRNTENLKNEIDELNLGESFTVLGHRDDIPRILKSFDLFFFPSTTEGQPNALIEAMLAEVPLIASNIRPIKECLPESHFKYLCSPHDYECFARKIKRLLESDKLETNTLHEWAVDKFNAKKNFKLFENKLGI